MPKNVTLQSLWDQGLVPQVTDRLGVSYFVLEHLPLTWVFEIPDEVLAEFDFTY